VYEQSTSLEEVGAGLTVSPNATHVLNAIGLDRVLPLIGLRPSRGGVRHWRSGELLFEIQRGSDMLERYGAAYYQVHRADLHGALVDLIPVYEDQLKVTQWHSDLNTPETYGKPAMYQYRMHQPTATDTQAQPDKWEDVHPSRVQILAEGSVGDMFDGVPLLKAGFNALVDLEKISGGSAESFGALNDLSSAASAASPFFSMNAFAFGLISSSVSVFSPPAFSPRRRAASGASSG
jgi:hypothetical protein